MSAILALDASEWQGQLSKQHFEYAYALGIRLYIAQLWGSGPTGNGPNDHAEEQLAYAEQAGLKLAGYIWVPPDDIAQTDALYETAARAAGTLKDKLCFIAPDLEGRRLHPTDPSARLRNLCEVITADGFPIIIYNRRNNWATVMGPNVTEFSRYPLWEARYFLSSGYRLATAPDIDWSWYKYGGWQQRAALQYAGTAPVNGWSADWNVLAPERLGFELAPRGGQGIMPQPQPREETELSSQEYIELKSLIDAVNSGVIEAGNALTSLTTELRAHTQHPTPVPPPSPTPMRDRDYIVQPGDSLSLIAKRILNNAGRYRDIAVLNYDRYPSLRQNVNIIQVGWTLRIPQN